MRQIESEGLYFFRDHYVFVTKINKNETVYFGLHLKFLTKFFHVRKVVENQDSAKCN